MLFFIVIAFVQPQNRFLFLYPLRIANITGLIAILLHFAASSHEKRPAIRLGPGSLMAILLILFSLVAQYMGALQTKTEWNQAIDTLIKTATICLLIEGMCYNMQRVWAVQCTLMLSVLWWIKGGVRLSTSGATYMDDRIMGAAVSMISNPNGFAYYLSACIPIFYYFYKTEKNAYLRYAMVGCIFAAVYIVLQTGSRTGLVCLLVLGLFFLKHMAGHEKRLMLVSVVILYLLVGLVSPRNLERLKTIRHSMLFLVYGDDPRARPSNVDEQSSIERAYRNRHTWRLITMYPMGIGLNPDPKLYPEEVSFAAGTAHNELLMAGRGMGYHGMVLYVAVVITPLILGLKIRRALADTAPPYAELGSAFVGQALVFIVGGNLISNPFTYPEMILLGCSSAMWTNLKKAAFA